MKRPISLTILALTATLSLFAVNAQSQNLLTNANFATDSLTPWVPFNTSNGTNGPLFPNVLTFSNQAGGPVYAAHFNVGEVNYDETQQGGGIDQAFQVITSGRYDVFANIGSETDKEANADAGTFSIIIDGTTIATKSLGAFSSANQIIATTLSGSVELTTGSHTEMLITRGYVAATGGVTPNECVTNLTVTLNPLAAAGSGR
jgi:hypothetical protein